MTLQLHHGFREAAILGFVIFSIPSENTRPDSEVNKTKEKLSDAQNL